MSARLWSAWRRSWRGLAVLAIAGGMIAALPRGGFAETAAVKVRFGGDQASTRIVLDIDHAVQGKLVSGGQGGREVVMDFPKLVAGGLDGQGRGLVGAWTLERTVTGARLKLTLDKGATVEKRFLLAPADGVATYRYVIDLKAAGAAAPPARTTVAAAAPVKAPVRSAAGATVQKVSTAPAATPVRNASLKKTIVIDAGHGGRDPGALGSEAREKDVTLAAAKALKARLEKTGRYRVVLTRSSDVYVPLENRLQIARNARANLLISLHADAVLNKETRGGSVYTVSDKGSDRAARHQGGGGFLNVALPGSKAVHDILFELTQRATRNKSSTFAEILISKVGGHAPLLSRAHRDANYLVLLAPDVPSVLYEMGFITNQQDEALLTSESHRTKVVGGIASAIDEYFAQEDGVSIL
jgi:N-acetylmuramoyl-L-alanine amidase